MGWGRTAQVGYVDTDDEAVTLAGKEVEEEGGWLAEVVTRDEEMTVACVGSKDVIPVGGTDEVSDEKP